MCRKPRFQSVLAGVFLLAASSASALNVSNPSAIAIPSIGSATPYPSSINIANFSEVVNDVNVTLHGLTHTFPADLDILLVGPGGQSVLLMSDAGGGSDLNGITLVFDDQAAASLPNPITAGTYKPTNIGTGDSFPAPAPSGSYGAQLSVFNGTAANGAWQLFVFDDGLFADGNIAGGWSLAINLPNGSSTVPEPPVVLFGLALIVGSIYLRRRARGTKTRQKKMRAHSANLRQRVMQGRHWLAPASRSSLN